MTFLFSPDFSSGSPVEANLTFHYSGFGHGRERKRRGRVVVITWAGFAAWAASSAPRYRTELLSACGCPTASAPARFGRDGGITPAKSWFLPATVVNAAFLRNRLT